jgi:hypothetical protein
VQKLDQQGVLFLAHYCNGKGNGVLYPVQPTGVPEELLAHVGNKMSFHPTDGFIVHAGQLF